MMVALAAAAGAAFALLVSLVRLFAGPTLSDRTLAANGVLIKAALITAAIATAANRPEWIDVAFAFVLGAITLSAAFLKAFRARTFQAPLSRDDI